MSNLDLTNLGVQELSEAELATIEGGNIFKDAVNGVKTAVQTVGDWFELQLTHLYLKLCAYESDPWGEPE